MEMKNKFLNPKMATKSQNPHLEPFLQKGSEYTFCTQNLYLFGWNPYKNVHMMRVPEPKGSRTQACTFQICTFQSVHFSAEPMEPFWSEPKVERVQKLL